MTNFYLFAILTNNFPHRYVWSTSIKKVQEYASKNYSNSFSVRPATLEENGFVITPYYAI